MVIVYLPHLMHRITSFDCCTILLLLIWAHLHYKSFGVFNVFVYKIDCFYFIVNMLLI